MRLSTVLETADTQIRARVCRSCPRRPWDSRSENASIPWLCQRGCPIFQILPSLISRTDWSGLTRDVRERIIREALQAASGREWSRIRATLLKRYADEIARTVAGLVETV